MHWSLEVWKCDCLQHLLWTFYFVLWKSQERQRVRRHVNVAANFPEHLLLLDKMSGHMCWWDFLFYFAFCRPVFSIFVINGHQGASLFSTCCKYFQCLLFCLTFCLICALCRQSSATSPWHLLLWERFSCKKKSPAVKCLCEQHLRRKSGMYGLDILPNIHGVHVWKWL